MEHVIVTLGEKGAAFISRETKVLYETRKVEAVDTTAAGATFNAAIAVFLSQAKTIEQAIRFANLASGISVTRQGAQPSVPSREEVEALAAEIG